jgi:hypothetical protein
MNFSTGVAIEKQVSIKIDVGAALKLIESEAEYLL